MRSHEFERGQDVNRGKGGTTHGFAMKDVGAPPPELPGIDPGIGKVIGPTKAEAKAANAREYAPTGLARVLAELAENWKATAAVGVTLAAGGAVLAHKTIPAVQRGVNTLGDSVAEWFRDRIPGEPIEKKFPIKLDQSSFTPVTPEEEKRLWENTKTVDLEKHTFTIGFPAPQTIIDRSPDLRMNQEFNTYTFTPAEVEKLQKQGFKTDTQISGLYLKGDKFNLDYDSTKFDASIIEITTAGQLQGEGSNSFNPAYTTYRVIYRDKQTGRQYSGAISVLYGRPLVNAAPFPTDHHPVYEDGTPIKPDTQLAEFTTDLLDWDGKTGQVLPEQKGQVIIGSIGGGFASISDAIADAQKGIYNPDAYFTTSFLKTSQNTLAVPK